jgi:hypothetical protein
MEKGCEAKIIPLDDFPEENDFHFFFSQEISAFGLVAQTRCHTNQHHDLNRHKSAEMLWRVLDAKRKYNIALNHPKMQGLDNQGIEPWTFHIQVT